MLLPDCLLPPLLLLLDPARPAAMMASTAGRRNSCSSAVAKATEGTYVEGHGSDPVSDRQLFAPTPQCNALQIPCTVLHAFRRLVALLLDTAGKLPCPDVCSCTSL